MPNDDKVITTSLEKVLSVAMLTPMDDPHHDSCRWGAPVMLWGPPGIGKSGRVENVGMTVGLDLGVVYLSTQQPEDIGGIFLPDGKGGIKTITPLMQVMRLIEAKKGILFLDELSWARAAMQAAALGVVQNRRIAGQEMPGRIRILAAANPVDQAAGGFALTPPMANRFLHFTVGVPSVDDWASWLMASSSVQVTNISLGEDRIRAGWSEAWARTRGLGSSFIRKYRTMKFGKDDERQTLHHLPPPGHRDRGRAWASPRSWEMAFRCLAAAEVLGEREIGLDLLNAAVGPGYAVAWVEWCEQANLPNPEDILRKGWKPDRTRLDIAHAAYASAISYALDRTDPKEQRALVILAWKLLQTALDEKLADLALAPAVSLIRAGFDTKAGPDMAAVSKDIILRLGRGGYTAYIESV